MTTRHTTRTRLQRFTTPAIVLLLIASAGLNVVLSRELREARSSSRPSVPEGTQAPPLVGRSVDGHPLTITFDGEMPTLLYYFSAQCGWCERNWPNVLALHTQTTGRVRVIAVAADETIPPYMKEGDSPIPILVGVNADTRDVYRFRGTPSAVLVGANGRVARSWLGAWDGRPAQTIADYFDVTLPGLTSKRASN